MRDRQNSKHYTSPNKMKRLLSVPLLLLVFFALSCGDEAPRFSIPSAPVNFRIETLGRDHTLKNGLAYKTFKDADRRTPTDRMGFAGLLVVSDASGNSLFAYDLCCPHEDRRDVTVTPSDNGKAVCPVCGSVFVTMYGLGSVESGPASEPLQRYAVIPQSGGVYLIRN